MARHFTIGIIQMAISRDFDENYAQLERALKQFSRRNPRPELILGVEGGIGYGRREALPGPISRRLGELAKRYGVYFVPGTMFETSPECGEGLFYNSAPIFGPDGRLLDVYRKMAPWRPAEHKTCPGRRYVVFEIPEKRIRVGVIICYDLNFPEIPRNTTLEGAEVILKLTQDPEEVYRLNLPLHQARAVENQIFLVSSNASGFSDGHSVYGHSAFFDPEGRVLLEAGRGDALISYTIDVDQVTRVREYGTQFSDHYLQHLRDFRFPMPYADDVSRAPVYRALSQGCKNPAEYAGRLRDIQVGTIGAGEE